MKLEQLLIELGRQSQTLGWGAVMAVSQASVNARLAASYAGSVTRLPALTSRINLIQDGSEFLEARELSLGAPQLLLGKGASARAAVRLPLVGGVGTYRQIPGQSASSGRLLTTQSIGQEAGYQLELSAELKVAIDAFDNRAHVFIDLTTAANPSCNLWPYAEGAERIANTLMEHIAALPRAFSQIPLVSVDLNVRDAFSAKDVRVAFQPNPENPDDGALLVFLQLNAPDTGGAALPGPTYPYLIPSDTDPTTGAPLYGVTWLINETLAELLPGQAEGQQPACILQTSFGDGQVLREGARHVPKDWAAFGRLVGSGDALIIEPSAPELIAGQSLRFSAVTADGKPLPGVTWSTPRAITPGASAGTIDTLGNYTAPAAETFPQDVVEVVITAQRTANGQTQQAYAVFPLRRQAVMQQVPMQVLNLWDERSKALGALSLGQDGMRWALADAPLAGEAVAPKADNPRLAEYTAPASLASPLTVRWVEVAGGGQAAQAGTASKAGIIVLSQPHPLNVEPALVEALPPGKTCAFKVLELQDGVVKLADGQTQRAENTQWSVIGEGSISSDGVYTPPAAPSLPFDVVYFDISGVFAGYAVVRTGQRIAVTNPWTDLALFSVTADYGNAVYANGGQQIPVRVTVRTQPYNDDGVIRHNPISAVELASMRLVDKQTRQLLATLEPYEEGLAEGALWATRVSRNRYDLPRGLPAPAEEGTLAEGDVERTRTRTLYVHTHSTSVLEIAASFTKTLTDGQGQRLDSDSSSYEGPTSLTLVPQRVPTFDRRAYRFPDGGDEGQGSRLDKPTYWRGEEYLGSENELERWYGMASDTTTRYPLSLAAADRGFVSMGLIGGVAGAPIPEELVVNQARWESNYWGEGGYSYTAAALNPLTPSESDLPWDFLGLGVPLRRLDAQQREAGLPLPMPAHGPYQPASQSVPLFNRLAAQPPVGAAMVVLERRGDMTYQWDDQSQEGRLKDWKEELEAPLNLRLRDNVGNLHQVSIGFAPENAQNSNRNDLRMLYPASTLLAGEDGDNAGGLPSARGAQQKRAGAPRAPASALHSNAFNFLSFLEGGVDPRTGQYTLQLAFPSVLANQLAGPELALRLGFDPFNQVDAGYGQGWTLNLSQVDTYGQGRLRLSSGEAFMLNAIDANGEYVMVERKVPVCRLFKDGAGYRLVHRDGAVEYLEIPGVGDLALPKTIQAATGHRLHFTYDNHEGNARLASVTDDSGRQLLGITPIGSNLLEFRFPAEGQATPVTFKAELNSRRLERLVLPTVEASSWRLRYRDINGYPCVTEVQTPTGALETITYDDAGHSVPGNARPPLPRVHTHVIAPGAGQSEQTVTYTYSGENFLGYPSVSAWSEEEDNLYNADWNFTYWSEATHVGAGVTRTVKRIYNSLHLLQEERTQQNDHVRTVNTEFHWRPGEAFAAQPNQCQLPRKVTTQWRLEGQSAVRDEVVETDYDADGNLTKHTAETGVVTEYEYYPGTVDSESCPKDPHGFTRYEKSRTVVPSTRFVEPGAPRLVTVTTYRQLPALPSSSWAGPVVKHTQSLTEGADTVPARLDTYSWYDDADQAFTLGRLACQETVLWGESSQATQRRYEYRLEAGEAGGDTVLKTDIVTLGFDGTKQIQYLEQSTLTGLMLLERHTQSDEDKVDIRRRYDALQRVVEEIIAPDTDQEASQRYSYTLVDSATNRAEQTVTDVKGLRLRTVVDGLGRAIAEHRREPGGTTELQTYAAEYDSLGQLTSAIEWDDFGPQRVAAAMTEHYEYDDWGQRYAVLGADGVRRVEAVDPLGVPNEGVTEVRRSWLEGQAIEDAEDGEDGECDTVRSGLSIDYVNAFGQTVKTLRKESQDAAATHLYRYDYDGLGRKVRQTDPLLRETGYAYDLFDRNVKTTLPDGAQVVRAYATHSSEDLPISISLIDSSQKEHLLGTQTFDGVGRMTEAVTGGRRRQFNYKQHQTRPHEVITPKGHTLVYEYQPRLGDQPILRRVGGDSAPSASNEEHYEYDQKDARLVRCLRAEQEVLTRSYHSNGQLRTETRLHEGRTLAMHYDYSVQGRLLSYTDVTGQTQNYTYDPAHGGRLSGTSLDGLECTLEYDSLGRDSKVTTVDTQADTSLSTALSYDVYGREIKRCFTFSESQTETLEQEYDELDRIVLKTLKAGDGSLLRQETFDYDALGHLSMYVCSGPECPQDPYGHTLTGQIFECDALDNHTVVLTTWTEEAFQRALQAMRWSSDRGQALVKLADEGMNVAQYAYDNPNDPAQLTGIVNSHPSYPAQVKLTYDAEGNLLNDEWGRQFEYDALGRLIHVSALENEPSSVYHYDPLDIISARSEPSGTMEGRFYRDGELHTLLEADSATAIVRAGEHLLAEQNTSDRVQPESIPHE